MIPIGDLSILVPVDVSSTDPPPLSVLDTLRPFEVVLLGYFPVPDQAEPALLKGEYGAEASARLGGLADGRRDVTEVLVFTHDREATIDRVADQYGCDAVLTAGDTDTIARVLVPVRGEANLERLVSVVAGLLRGGEADVTFFHSVGEDADPDRGESLLRETVERLTEFGIEGRRVDWRLSDGGDVYADVVELADEYDLVVLGETEPSLRERIIGDVLSRIIDDLTVPALIVRDIE